MGMVCFSRSGFKKGPPDGAALSMVRSVHDLNDPMRSRIDQHGSIVDDRVAVMSRPIFAGNLVIRNAAARKLGAHAHFTLVAIGRMAPFRDVAVEARPRVVGDAARGSAGNRAHRGPDRTAD